MASISQNSQYHRLVNQHMHIYFRLYSRCLLCDWFAVSQLIVCDSSEVRWNFRTVMWYVMWCDHCPYQFQVIKIVLIRCLINKRMPVEYFAPWWNMIPKCFSCAKKLDNFATTLKQQRNEVWKKEIINKNWCNWMVVLLNNYSGLKMLAQT